MNSGNLTPGSYLSEFRIDAKLGMGGCGIVYEAHQERLDRRVAVKVLLPSAATRIDDLSQRFLREIDLCRRLEHPNIVRLYDYGETNSGLLWMAMELVQGSELKDILRKTGKMPPKRARKIMLQVLSGLAEAHSLGIVHRDLKPGNIMLTQKGADRDVVKLLDFGIGKALGEGENAAIQDLTMEESHTIGTPRYMSPELLTREDVGPHVDVYAAGLILLEMLSGERAVEGDTTFQILANQLNNTIELPQSLIGTRLGDILRKATHKDWELRYPSALEFHRALEEEENLLSSSPGIPAPNTARLQGIEADSEPVDLGLITAELLEDMGEIEVFDDDDGSFDISRPLEPPAEKKSRAPLILLALVLLGAAGLGWYLLRDGGNATRSDAEAASGQSAESPPSTPDQSSPENKAEEEQTATPPLDPTPTAPEGPSDWEWSFRTAPAGAAVTVDGKNVCEATPCDVLLPAGDAKQPVTLELEGYETVKRDVVFDRQGMLDLSMNPVKEEEREDDKEEARASSDKDEERKKRRRRNRERRQEEKKSTSSTPAAKAEKKSNPFNLKAD